MTNRISLQDKDSQHKIAVISNDAGMRNPFLLVIDFSSFFVCQRHRFAGNDNIKVCFLY